MDQFWRDVGLAHQRIGTTPDDRGRWLLSDCLEDDPAELSAGERATLRDNLVALMLGLPGPERMPTQKDWAFDDPVWTDDSALGAVWAQLGALATAHHQPGAKLPAAKEERLQQTWPAAPYVKLERVRQLDGAAAIRLDAAAAVLAACTRLRECPECRRLFVARRRQERHPTCARRARDARRPSRQPVNQKRPKKAR